MDAVTSTGSEHDALRARLFAYRIGPEIAVLSFRDRLARENRWSSAYARRVIHEYYRFCYLAMTAGHEVTPSDQVDQAWHLHPTYTRDYWQRFCPDVLGAPLHHGPTAGGQDERARYYDQYAETLKSYQETFGEAPPPDIWSSASERFGEHPRAFRAYPSQIIFMKDVGGIARLLLTIAASLAVGIALGVNWEG